MRHEADCLKVACVDLHDGHQIPEHPDSGHEY